MSAERGRVLLWPSVLDDLDDGNFVDGERMGVATFPSSTGRVEISEPPKSTPPLLHLLLQ